MSGTAIENLRLSPDISLTQRATGEWFAKHGRTRKYFRVGDEEQAILTAIDRGDSADAIRASYQRQFDDELTPDDLAEFAKSAESQGLLVDRRQTLEAGPRSLWQRLKERAIGRSAFYFRLPLWDPDAFLSAVTPRVSWLWTRPAAVSYLLLGCIASAIWVANWDSLSAQLTHGFGLQSTLLVWAIIIVATMFHELAHGATCKRYGGNVPEIGLLFMFFTPCMYCNVSDAYLLPRRWHRVLITLAGPICDLVIWSTATIVWRMTVPNVAVNQLALLVGSVCGARTLLNINPFSRVDGYYILTDLIDRPNLRRQGLASWLGVVRWWLWGAERPADASAKVVAYGFMTWLMQFLVCAALLYTGVTHLWQTTSFLGGLVMIYLGTLVGRYIFRGTTQGEVRKMLKNRPSRRTAWGAAVAGTFAVLLLVPVRDRSAGQFSVRPSQRVELRSVVEGFVGEILVEEGAAVSAGQLIARLQIPDLESRLRTKEAELQEAAANLRRLEAGPRPELLAAHRQKIDRAAQWLQLAEHDLGQNKLAFEQDLSRLDKQVAQAEIELGYARQTLDYATTLYQRGAYAGQQLRSDQRRLELAQLSLDQVRVQRRNRETTGWLEARTEVERRRKDMADARAELTLLEAGTRPEELEAERARHTRLNEELQHLRSLATHRELRAPAAGIIATPRLCERRGAYLQRGELLCEIQNAIGLDAEIVIDEREIVGVALGQSVELIARAMPTDRFHGLVTHIGSKAVVQGQISEHSRGNLVVHCHLSGQDARLLTGMTGFARIYREPRSIGGYLTTRVLRTMRTELWL